FKKVNDPRESKGWSIHAFTGILDSQGNQHTQDKMRRIASYIKCKEWKFCGVSKSRSRNETDSSYLPFSSGDENPSLWAHYSGKHKGICLKFDGEKLDYQIQLALKDKGRIFYGDVDYNDKKVLENTLVTFENGSSISQLKNKNLKELIRRHFDENHENHFLLKAECWESEQEFRWLFHSEKDEPEIVSFGDALVGVT